MNPRVLLAASSLANGFGGIQQVARLMTRAIAEELQDRGELQALTLFDKEPADDLKVAISPCGGSKLRLGLRAMCCRATHLISDSCNLGQLQWLPGLRKLPHLTALHGIEIWEDAKPRWVRSARSAHLSLFVTDYSRRRAESVHGPFPNAVVCWSGTELDEAPRPELRRGSLDVLIVGRLEGGYKGHKELIEAWPTVLAEVPGATLRIIGRGPDRETLETLAARSGAGTRVVFEGFVPQDRLDEMYSRAALLAMPSRGEGFGLVYIDAMRYGLPTIASVHDAAQEIVIDGETGYTVDLDQPGQLAERIIRLLRNPELAARLGAAGWERWNREFRFSRYRARFRPILTRFLAHSSRAN